MAGTGRERSLVGPPGGMTYSSRSLCRGGRGTGGARRYTNYEVGKSSAVHNPIGHLIAAGIYSHQMTARDFTPGELPAPQQWLRKHVFGGRDYQTLMVVYVAQRVFEGVPYPRILRCSMFGTLARQEELDASDIETGQMLLDALFRRCFPEHQCNEHCTDWPKSSADDDDDDPPDSGPVRLRIQ